MANAVRCFFNQILKLSLMAFLGVTIAGCGKVSGGLKSLKATTEAGVELSSPQVTYTVTEGSTLPILFTLGKIRAKDSVVTLTMTSPRGDSAQDFLSFTQTVTIPAGDIALSTVFATVDDFNYEGTESFTLIVTSSDGDVKIKNAEIAIIVNDNDSAGPPTLVLANASAAEQNAGNSNMNFTVTLSGTWSSAVVVDYATTNGTATTADSDYTATSGTLTIASGSTVGTFSVPVSGDTKYEASETFTVTLSGGSGYTSAGSTLTATGTITNDDTAPTLTIADVSVAEGTGAGTTTATFTVTSSGLSGLPVTIDYASSDGTATVGDSDYTAVSGTLTIAAGSTTATVDVPVLRNAIYEANETFSLTISNPAAATIVDSVAVGTITNDDTAPTISIANVSLAEGAAGASNMTFTITSSAVSGAVLTVNYATSDSTATTADSDYGSASSTATIAAGSTTTTFNVVINGDTNVEFSEVFNVTLSGGAGYTSAGSTLTATGTITTDDCLASPSISIADVTVTEGNAGTVNANFVVTTTGAACSDLTMVYNTSNSTATAGSDYTAATSQTLTISGATVGTIAVVVAGDTTAEGTETFNVTISSASAGTFSDATGIGTITNDDSDPFMWTGTANDGNWDTGTNWFGGTKPNNSQIAIFNNLCTNCNVTTQTNDVLVGGIRMDAGYTGIITQLSNKKFTVRGSGLIMQSGTFELNQTFESESHFNITGGTLTVASGTLVDLIGTGASCDSYNLNTNGAELQNLTFRGGCDGYEMSASTVTVNETLTLKDQSSWRGSLTNGTVIAKGPVALDNYGMVGSGLLKIAGSSNQVVSINGSNALLPDTEIASTGGTVTISGVLKIIGKLTHTSGTTTISGTSLTITSEGWRPSADITVTGGTLNFNSTTTTNSSHELVQTGGTVNITNNASFVGVNSTSGTFNATTANLTLLGGNCSAHNAKLGSTTVANLTFNGGCDGFTHAGTTTVTGNLTLNDTSSYAGYVSGGTIEVGGNVVSSNYGKYGTVKITLVGTGTQTINSVPNAYWSTSTLFPTGDITINKPSGAVVMASAMGTVSGSQKLIMTAGTLDMAGYNLTVTGQLTMAASTVIYKGCGTLTEAGGAVSAGSYTRNSSSGYVYEGKTVTLSMSDPTVNEGNAGTANMNFVVTASAAQCGAQTTTFSYATSNGTATTADSDYTSASGTATIPNGSTVVTISVTVNGDTKYEADETLTLGISSPVNGIIADNSGTGTITNDDAVPNVQFSAASQSVAEDVAGGNGLVVVELSKLSAFDAVIPFTLTGTATGSGTDYTTPTSPLTITAGATVATITIPINDDSSGEGNETIIFTIGTPTDANATGNTVHTLTIADDDIYVNFAAASQNFNESSGRTNTATWPSGMEAWSKRVKLSLGNASRASNLTNFPVLVKLDSTRITYSDFKASGADIRFTDPDGTALSYEIESWDASGSSFVWVKVPQIDASSNADHIIMYYGNSAAADAQAATSVWNSNYIGVWHLNSATADSTSNAITGTDVSTGADTSGAIGNARTFNGTSSYINLGNPASVPNGTNSITLCAWAKHSSLTWNVTQIYGSVGTNASNQYVAWGTSNYFSAYGFGSSGWDFRNFIDEYYSVKASEWSLNCLVKTSGTGYTFYKNGVAIKDITIAAGHSLVRNVFYIGRNVHGSHYMNGSLDEFRLMSGAASADWMSAEYASQSDTLLGYGAVESRTTGTVANIVVNLTAAAPAQVTVPYTVSGTANGSDHSLSSGTLTIDTGNSSGTIYAPINKDYLVEANETIIVDLGAPTGAAIGTDIQHTVTILDAGAGAAPVSTDDSLTFEPDSVSKRVAVLANDSDADSDTLMISAVTQGTYLVVKNLGREVVVSRPFGYTGIDTFTYTVSDGFGGTSTSTVTMTVRSSTSQWTGATSSSWGTAGNWYNNSAPSGVAYISSSFCTANCNITIDSNIWIDGIYVSQNYAHTITQNPTRTIDVQGAGFRLFGGTFMGGDSAITSSLTHLVGGSFTSTSGTFNVGSGRLVMESAAVFNHNSGTVAASHSNGTFTLGAYSTQPLYNLTTSGSAGGSTFINSPTVVGTYTLNNSSSYNECIQGTLDVKGPMTLNSFAGTSYYGCAGLIRISGSGNQTITSTAGNSGFPSLEIASTGGTVTFSGDLNVMRNFTHTSGTVVMPTNITFGDDYLYSEAIVPGNIQFNNVIFDWGWTNDAKPITGTMTVNGNLTLEAPSWSPSLNTGTVDLKGNLILENYGAAGSATIKMSGTGTQTINQNSTNARTPNTLIIDKPSGQVNLTSNVNLNHTSLATQITSSSVLYMNSYTLGLKSLTFTSGTIHRGDGATPAGAGTFTINGAGVSDGAYGGGTIVNP